MTKVLLLLSYFDEDPGMLGASIKSASPYVDAVVALEGRYSMFPSKLDRSPREQLQTIDWCAAQYGLELLHHSPGQPWKDEIEKRTFHFRLAETISQPDDWYFILDADTQVKQWDLTKEELSASKHDVGESLHLEAFGERIAENHVRNFFRAQRGLYLAGNHYTYRTADDRILWGNGGITEEALDLTEAVILHHHNQHRPVPRMKAAQDYYNERDTLGVERGMCQVCQQQKSELNWPHQWRPNTDGTLVAGWCEVCPACLPVIRKRTMKAIRKLGYDPLSIQFQIHPKGPFMKLADLHRNATRPTITQNILTKETA